MTGMALVIMMFEARVFSCVAYARLSMGHKRNRAFAWSALVCA